MNAALNGSSSSLKICFDESVNSCNSMQIFIYCKATLHVSGVTAPIIRSIKNCIRSLRYRSYYLYRYSPQTWSDRDWFVRVQSSPDQTTLEGSSGTSSMTCNGGCGYSFNTPDDGCCDTRNTSASVCIRIPHHPSQTTT